MTITLIITGILVIILIRSMIKSGTNDSVEITYESESSHQSKHNFHNTTPKSAPIETYKNPGLKSFNIVGTYFRDNVNKSDLGNFIGYVKTEDNRHDRYAVAVYTQSGKQLGYTPKGNQRLNKSLSQWHYGKTFAWGSLGYDDYNQSWYGEVYIPIGLKGKENVAFQTILENKMKIDEFKGKELNTEESFQILDKALEALNCQNIVKKHFKFEYPLHKNFIPSLSSRLEKNKDWEQLIRLKKYNPLINELSESFRGASLRRIKKAEEKFVKIV
ncbi:HIRAN domain-containing protein [Marinifilum sp. D714]|uniref:HIRAN domain-containing protein n=1 Tax=Marinifilum sp. D714 TaxID=2937523 RepID=UPI0027BED301|nr:HIRAN domain-containing protein [Marinifilum sp. D714]MDQ2180471.1 HIRAN domain-containing protein [Marinifilum sp. D714]